MRKARNQLRSHLMNSDPTLGCRMHPTQRGGNKCLVHCIVRDHEHRLAPVRQNPLPAAPCAVPQLLHRVVAVDAELGRVLLPLPVQRTVPLLPFVLQESLETRITGPLLQGVSTSTWRASHRIEEVTSRRNWAGIASLPHTSSLPALHKQLNSDQRKKGGEELRPGKSRDRSRGGRGPG